jgi:hypothetical protein
MAVGVGSFCDPPEMQGLSHYLLVKHHVSCAALMPVLAFPACCSKWFACFYLTALQAAAAMAVGVGSFCDPPEMQGLSHYLEHMLFMGSDKFPDENEYDSFLSKHGGSSNAFTELVRSWLAGCLARELDG